MKPLLPPKSFQAFHKKSRSIRGYSNERLHPAQCAWEFDAKRQFRMFTAMAIAKSKISLAETLSKFSVSDVSAENPPVYFFF